ncbi:hypothetical protein E1287_25765 [Actinomadura sp. KC06]|uniref:hypothetical protein n=1 Tax=Actinomadura sp. KC06 TaxID=2530369 RepID=UPI00104716FB|nr:hypothetical protein [Actinomadura sp. KC06]TDD31671.1 hypothetical protein E1287_25765 [Actinomadura sp. KC06]
MRKPLRDMKTIRNRIDQLLDTGDYTTGDQGTIDAALDAAQPVLDEARAEHRRLRDYLASANAEIRRLRRVDAERNHLARQVQRARDLAVRLRREPAALATVHADRIDLALDGTEADRG